MKNMIRYRGLYLWVRQGEKILYADERANIDRLGVSKDTVRWTVYDFIASTLLTKVNISSARFDYPDTVLTDNYLYLTTSVSNLDDNKQYGLILRLSLDDLASHVESTRIDSESFDYDVILERGVESISPVDGASNPMYFGAHVPGNSSQMKIFTWPENSSSPHEINVPITPWTSIKNQDTCGLNSTAWWCKANTSSRIRSAWMFKDSINFLWNALVSYDDGRTWSPYVDSATFFPSKNMDYERKYYVADEHTAWMFAAAAPSEHGNIGVTSFYYDIDKHESHTHPFLNLAFGVFDDKSNKWDLTSIANSTAPLPVKNEAGRDDYNFGDFLTIKAHTGKDGGYLWDIGGYVIVGKSFSDIEPYFIMVR